MSSRWPQGDENILVIGQEMFKQFSEYFMNLHSFVVLGQAPDHAELLKRYMSAGPREQTNRRLTDNVANSV